MRLVSAQEMRRLDELTIQRFGQPGYVLMERAGAGAAQLLLRRFPQVRGERVVVVCGKGNNGGDGFVVARLLCDAGVEAEAVLLGTAGQVKGDAERALTAMREARVPFVEIERDLPELGARLRAAALVVDAVFGTGLNATVTGFYAEAIAAMNACGAPIFAIDIPSGLNSDSGSPLGVCVRAAATATFGFAKLGQVMYPGIDAVGELTVVDIGIAAGAVAEVEPNSWLLEEADVAGLVPSRAPDSHKGTFGHVLVLAGSRGHSGAAQIAAHAACRTGAGLTSLAGPASLNSIFSAGVPEVMTIALADDDGLIEFDDGAVHRALAGKTAVVVGPGLGTHPDARKTVHACLAQPAAPVVLDADALTCLAHDLGVIHAVRGRLILTPHPGEMARLLGVSTAAVQADRVGTARRFATTHGCVLVLKGARTVIAAPDGAVWINPTGNPGMASGGMGDALAGILGGLLSQGMAVEDAARLGVYLHGAAADQLAADYAAVGYLASDVVREVPRRLGALRALATGQRP